MKTQLNKVKQQTFVHVETEVMRVHNLFWESYARRDIELRFSLCSDDITFIGSGLHERALNKAEYKNINKEGVKQFPYPFQIEFLWTNITMLSENVACVESEVVWSQLINDEMTKELLRNTTLLKRNNSKWLVTHVHGSVPDYRLKDGDYMTNEQTIIRNKELERQVFERTRDLNKTLEELEQKNRELEIEGTLEKVRAIAMGMREPTDMLDVCKTISFQLQFLGVKEIRNVQTAIFYEQRGTYMNYEFYAKHDKTFITETVFTNNEIHNEFATKMLKGRGETFITHIKDDEVKDWIAYQKTTNVFIDKYLETASSLNYYWFSLGPVALGISTYIPLTEDEINLFKRFLKVFELAYQRYLDIEKAETQAREAKIEAALERVRAMAMSMNKPNDLLNVCEVLFKEFQKLGFDEMRNAMINIHNDENKTFLNYDYSDQIGKSKTLLNFDTHPVMEKQIMQSRIANDAFSEAVYEGKDLEDWKEFRRKYGEKDDPRIENITALYYYFYSIGNGTIGISTFSSINEEKLTLVKRFRNVFNLAYQRYSDLALAEAQAREAQIEAALERVRSKTMGMQKSDELKEVIKIVYQQLTHLKINVDHAGFVVDYIPKGDWHFWIADERDIPSKITHPYFKSVWASQFNEAKEKGLEFFTTNLNFEEKNKFYNELLSYVPGLPEASKDFYLNCPGLAATTVLMDNVGLYIENFSGFPYTDEENKILIRFGKVFQQTYTRFLDLQKAEAQNKIIQAENDRKTKELEEARQLQLSLLPKTLPRLPQFDIAVYMKTATEVGGDYYDFKVQENGVLNIGIGDATGHGLQAGTMITLMKGFFTSDAAKFNPQKFLEHCNGMIREIKLGRILMSFSHLRFNSNSLLVSSAGMPPIYYHHKKNNRTEEIIIQGLPLGAMGSASYKLVEKQLNGGDTILLLTDGLPEQMNSHKMIFDYSRVLKYFDEIAESNPNDIINRLVQKANEWMDGMAQVDDITFVVIRVL
jgi:hypothetical protein